MLKKMSKPMLCVLINQCYVCPHNIGLLLRKVQLSCGRIKGPPTHSETWWNSEIQLLIDKKKLKYKAWSLAMKSDAADVDVEKDECGEVKKRVKRAVAIAKDTEGKEFVADLDTEEG